MARKRPSKKKPAAKKAAATKPKKPAPAKKAAPAKPKPTPKAKPAAKEAPKKAAPKAKPVTVKDLLKKQFGTGTPSSRYTVPKAKVEKSTFTAPELLAGFAAADVARIRGLLANTYSAEDLKAAAEKAAAEKAAAEKAAAEKAAAEKAAAEKAAAEKAAAEKAAAEKAAAEKAAAEKAEEIKKAAARKSDVTVSYASTPTQPNEKKPADPVDNTIKILAAGLAFLILLVIGASASNSFKYYLDDNQGTLEIWKGKFAPLGKEKVLALPGVTVPETLEAVYAKGDVYPLAFHFFVDRADALLKAPGIPDFEGIKAELKTALDYASTRELRDIAFHRLDNIDRLILVYKADVSASRGTIEDLQSAIGFLEAADKLTADEAQAAMIAQKIERWKAAITSLEAQTAAEQAAAAAEAEADDATRVEEAADTETEAEDDLEANDIGENLESEAVVDDEDADEDDDADDADEHAQETAEKPATPDAGHN